MKNKLTALLTLLLCLVLCLFAFVSCDIDNRNDDDEEEEEEETTEKITETIPSGELNDSSTNTIVGSTPSDDTTENTPSDTNDDTTIESIPNDTTVPNDDTTESIPDDTTTPEPHVHSYTDTVTYPTCTERGYTTHTCTCGNSYVDSYVNPEGHDWSLWEFEIEPTCTEPGKEIRSCRCGLKERQSIKANGHDYESVVTEPTCTERGYTTHNCHCGDSFIDTYVDANGHTEVVWSVDGFLEFSSKCNACGEVLQTLEFEYDCPKYEKLTLEEIGAKEAGEVEANYKPVGAVGISSLAEITDPYGSYYLTADISANEYTVSEFYGLFDGCGHTVTTTEPLFETFGGVVINLKLDGEISFTVEPIAPFANAILDGAIIANVKNTCNITVHPSEMTDIYAGGFAVYLYGEDVIFANCEYSGTIVNELAQTGNGRVTGGFLAMMRADAENNKPTVEFRDCTFSGSLTSTSFVGGLIGEAIANCDIYAYGCVNEGTVTNTCDGAAAGLFGGISGGNSSATVDMVNCANDGPVTSHNDAGGLVGRHGASGSVSMMTVKWCVNYKDIEATGWGIGGIIGSYTMYATFEECVNFGNLTALVATDDNGTPKPAAFRNYMGGITGMSDHGSRSMYNTYTKCINYGDINAYSSTHVRLGGITGDSSKSPFKYYECVNFGDITSHDVGRTQHRVGGISGGGGTNFELYDCVNFGDIKVSSPYYAAPSGGIVGYVANSQLLALVNCMNYGDVDVAVTATVNKETLVGPSVGGLCGWATGNAAKVIITGSINAGSLNSNVGIADILIWTKAGNSLLAKDIDINNTYYIPLDVSNSLYAPFLHSDELTDENGKNTLTGRQEEFSAKPEQISKSDLKDGTREGLAAHMTAKSAETDYATTFKCVKVQINEVEVITCVVSEAVAELITDNIIE